MPVQRKVGLEFQTYKGEWNIKQLQDGATPEEREEVEEEMRRGTLGKASKRLLKTPEDRISLYTDSIGFKVEMDGLDLEYITKAFDEETEKDRLCEAARQAGTVHENISHTMPKFAKEELGSCYSVEKGGMVYYINKKGEQTAHPQATIGVEYEKIPVLMERIAAAQEGDILYQEVPTAEASRSQMQANQKEIQEFIDGQEAVVNRERCVAFLQLVQEYIAAANGHCKRILDSLDVGLTAIGTFSEAVNKMLEDVDSIPEFKSADMDKGEEQTRQNLEKLCKYEEVFIGNTDTRILGEFQACFKINDPESKRAKFNALCKEADSRLYKVKLSAVSVNINILSTCNAIKESFRQTKENLERINEMSASDQLDKLQVMISACYNRIKQTLNRLKKDGEKYSRFLSCNEIAEQYKAVAEYRPVWFEKYFKTLLSVKTRTSFYDLYSKLDDNDKTLVFKYLEKYKDSLISAEDVPLDLVTFASWKEKMHADPKGSDLLCYELEEGRKDWAKYKKNFGVERSTDIGHDYTDAQGRKNIIDGALLELRKLKDKIPPSEWGSVAESICQIVREIHHPGIPASAPGMPEA